MTTHFFREVDRFKRAVLELSALVEQRLAEAVQALETRDAELARKVMDGDAEVDQREVDVEEDCLKILALHQPVAVDLRFVVAVLKINSDLERIGDLAVNIAELALFLAEQKQVSVALPFAPMAARVRVMVAQSLDALVNMNAELAREVCEMDDVVDTMNREMYEIVKTQLQDTGAKPNVNILLHLLSASRHLERIADHATNIAEDVIYMIEGRIVRHNVEIYAAGQAIPRYAANVRS